ncbi:TPA: ATP-binding protein [Stenotrophomonas maltophilia]|nr:ATP-binding protein [Stenotrophomonas maltophilia]
MKLDFRVLEHLGIRLYSNVAAVISELVANGWDAQAEKVTIDFDEAKGRLVIADDGIGMNVDDINDKFLTVGYDKRKTEGGVAKNGRKFMGRKGIGKLSVFSVAEVVKVFSTRDGVSSAFELRLKDLERDIKASGIYHPLEIPFPDDTPKKGTVLEMSSLQVKRTSITVNALRKRLARRFSVIGFVSSTGDAFDVLVNGVKIGHQDRDDLRSLEYMWEFGAKTVADAATPVVAGKYVIADNIVAANPAWQVTGWFGTAKKPAQLEGEESGSLKNIVVLARGRLIQESILDKLGFNRIFGSYVTGQIQADFLDTDQEEDIATSDRQRLVEDDHRVMALRSFMRKALLDASEKWSEVRKHQKAEEAQLARPALKGWVDGLPKEQQVPAKSLIGLIEGLPLDDEREQDRAELFRSGVLAFERLRLKEAAHRLENLSVLSADHLLPLLMNQEYYEASLYGDIVKSRVEAIRKFRDLADAQAKEKVLQEHLFKNLWLLDAGWERASGSETMERQLRTHFPRDFADNLTDEESKGRIDIKYRSNAGVHIIVELKKYERAMTLDQLNEQGHKYLAAMTKLCNNAGETQPRIEVVFVLGKAVPTSAGLPHNYVEESLRVWGARIAFYDTLIEGALAAYSDYLKANESLDRVGEVVRALSSE